MAGLDTGDGRSVPVPGATRERQPYRVLQAMGRGITRVLSVIALAVAWELFARSGAVTPFMLPPLSAVGAFLLGPGGCSASSGPSQTLPVKSTTS